jgi:hypothetical protein
MIYPQEHWLTKDEHGIQMPWYVRPFLEELDKWDLKAKNVYEYGVGYSSNWYACRGAIIDGVDSSDQWVGFSPTALYTTNKKTYIESILTLPTIYDIVVIDGDYRDNCTEYALKALKPGGKLIIDNWEQPSVEPNDWTLTKELIKGMDIKVYKEPTHPDWKTAVITKPVYNDNN